MIEHTHDAFQWLAKLNNNAREAIFSFVVFGMTTQQHDYITRQLAPALIIGVLGALTTNYINSSKDSVKLDNLSQQVSAYQAQSIKDRAEDRAEFRIAMRELAAERQHLADRTARIEALMAASERNGNGARK